MLFLGCIFQGNNGESQIYTDQLGTLIFIFVKCFSHNNLGGVANISSSCFNLRNIVVRMFDFLVIDGCKGQNSAGLKFFDNSTIVAGINEKNLPSFVRLINLDVCLI